MKRVIVQLKQISKTFPGVRALDGVDFSLQEGSVHGLVGENGAGKSTLMEILSGTYSSYEGQILLDGTEVHFHSERDALAAGISIVPQELSYIPELTIEENIFMGREPLKYGLLDKKQRLQAAQKLIAELALDFDPQSKMKDISIAQCQMVEIIKAISRNARIIIMDEPTSSLTSVETLQLFGHIKALQQKGIAFIYISHKLEEIFELCDTITVLRDSHYIGTLPAREATQDKLVQMMVGREIGAMYPQLAPHGEEELLRVEHLTRNGVFEDVSFTVKKGEVLGFSGMMGAGRSEVMRALFGIDRYNAGEIYLNGRRLSIHSPSDAIRAGFGMVTEDRAGSGFVPELSISDNIVFPNADIFAPHGFLKTGKIASLVSDVCGRIAVKAPSLHTKVINLSGGNQQKVVLAKWLIRSIKVLIMDEPTRGIDVGAKQEIYKLIQELSGAGMAVIMISSEMQEVIEVSHRVAVMDGGRILCTLSHAQATQDKIMQTIIEGGRKL